MTNFLQPLVVALAIVVSVSGAPPRNAVGRYDESNRGGYLQPQYYDPFEISEILNHRPGQDNSLVRFERTGLDSLSGATFGQSKKHDPTRFSKGKTLFSKSGVPKRNFDEIDRTNFDSFVKKNNLEIPKQMQPSYEGNTFEEIDPGFNGDLVAY